MLFTQKNALGIQQVVFRGFTLRKIHSSKLTKRATILFWDDTVMYLLTEERRDQRSPYKVNQARSSTLHPCQNLHNSTGLYNFLFPPLQPHPFHLRLQFSGHWLQRLCCRPNIYSNPWDTSRQDKPLFRIRNLSWALQSSYLKPFIHCGLKNLWSEMHTVAIRKPTGFCPF